MSKHVTKSEEKAVATPENNIDSNVVTSENNNIEGIEQNIDSNVGYYFYIVAGLVVVIFSIIIYRKS